MAFTLKQCQRADENREPFCVMVGKQIKGQGEWRPQPALTQTRNGCSDLFERGWTPRKAQTTPLRSQRLKKLAGSEGAQKDGPGSEEGDGLSRSLTFLDVNCMSAMVLSTWHAFTYLNLSLLMKVKEESEKVGLKLRSHEAERQRIGAFQLWCWRRLLRVTWTTRRSDQSILKETSPEYSLERLMLKLKLQYFWPPGVKNWLTGKDPDAGKDWRQQEKGMTEDEMVGWHHRLNGYECEQAPGVGDGQGSLSWTSLMDRKCYSPWDWKELDQTKQLNWLTDPAKLRQLILIIHGSLFQ